ncbi:unnamed protein product [Diamesa tonsa]
MGAYLSEPKTDKSSSEEENEYLKFGASSMQGWRINQEDAHNCILDFDDCVAFFAVYDGHGGSEVAEYCASKLPNFLKETETYKAGNYELALKDAFIGFDNTLLKEAVIAELKLLAKKNPDWSGSEEDEDDETAEDINDLYEESNMPLEKVLDKYKNHPHLAKLKEFMKPPNADGSKVQSPALNSKRSRKEGSAGGSGSGASSSCAGGSGASSSGAGGSGSSKVKKPTSEDSEVTSSSNKEAEKGSDASTEPSSSSAVNTTKKPEKVVSSEAPDSSSVIPKADTAEPSTNSKPESSEVSNGVGSITESTPTTTEDIPKPDDNAISSSVHENGETPADCSSSGVQESSPKKAETLTSTLSSNSMEEDTDDDSDDEADETFKVDKVPKVSADNDETSDDGMDDGSEEEGSEEDGEEEEDDEEEGSEDENPEDTMEDEEFMNNMSDEPGKDSGCTAVAAVLRGLDLYVANAGDSRCIVCRKGKVVEMSFDHKPEDTTEFERIRNAGGRVSADGRVNGGLNLSRAIGDHGYKTRTDLKSEEQMISALPDLRKLTLNKDDEFIVLACDGIWNFMNNYEVVQFVKTRLDAGNKTLSQICEELFDNCLAPNTMGDGTGCDNMTAIIVQFKPKYFEVMESITGVQATDAQITEEVISRKRLPEDDTEADLTEETECKRQKVDDDDQDMTPSTVDTSTA